MPGVVPQIARATADRGSSERPLQPATVVFPTAFQAVSGTTNNQRLVVFPGQFSDVDPTPGADAGTQLLIDQGSYTVYYADSTTAGDATKPFIQESTASAGLVGGTPGVVLFRVKATDPAGAADSRAPTGVKRVLVQYDETPSTLNTSHSWRPVELHQDTDGTWVGALITTRTDGRYFIQAVDGAGNTGVSQFKGNYYQADSTSPQAVAVVTDGTLGAAAGTSRPCRSACTSPERWPAPPTATPTPSTASRKACTRCRSTSPGDDEHHLHAARSEHCTRAACARFSQGHAGADCDPDTSPQRDRRRQSRADSHVRGLHDSVPGSGTAACTPLEPTSVTVAGNDYSVANAVASDVAGNTSPVASQTAVIVSGTKNPDGSFSAANGVKSSPGVGLRRREVHGQRGVDPGTIDSAAGTNTLSLSTRNTYAIAVTVPGSGGTAPVTVTFTVTVSDTIPPVLTLPAPGPTEATSPDGAVVSYTATATDNTDGRVTVPNTSVGFHVPLGTTTVTCSAHDNAENTTSGSFTVTVRDTTAPILTSPPPPPPPPPLPLPPFLRTSRPRPRPVLARS